MSYRTSLLNVFILMQLFGAFCSAAWAERKYKDDRGMRQNYFGNGETFLFKLANGGEH